MRNRGRTGPGAPAGKSRWKWDDRSWLPVFSVHAAFAGVFLAEARACLGQLSLLLCGNRDTGHGRGASCWMEKPPRSLVIHGKIGGLSCVGPLACLFVWPYNPGKALYSLVHVVLIFRNDLASFRLLYFISTCQNRSIPVTSIDL